MNKEFERVQLIALKEYGEEDRAIPKPDGVYSAAGGHDNSTLLVMLEEKD